MTDQTLPDDGAGTPKRVTDSAGAEEPDATRPVRPIDPTPIYPGDAGPPIPPLPHGPRPIDHFREDPNSVLVSPAAFVVEWDPQIPLSAEGRRRLERQIRKAVLAELAEADVDTDVSISAINEPGARGLRIQQM